MRGLKVDERRVCETAGARGRMRSRHLSCVIVELIVDSDLGPVVVVAVVDGDRNEARGACHRREWKTAEMGLQTLPVPIYVQIWNFNWIHRT